MLKEFLSQRRIAYIERDVARDPIAGSEIMRLTGQMAVPVTVIDGQTVVGFDRPKLEHILAMAGGESGPSFGAAVGDALRITKMRGLPEMAGAYVGGVKPGSLAQRAGLAVGDIIVEINGQRIGGADDLERVIRSVSSGSQVSISFSRGGNRLSGTSRM